MDTGCAHNASHALRLAWAVTRGQCRELFRNRASTICQAGEAHGGPGSTGDPTTCLHVPEQSEIWSWGVGGVTTSRNGSGPLATRTDLSIETTGRVSGGTTASCSDTKPCSRHRINTTWVSLLSPTEHDPEGRSNRGIAGAAMFLVLGITAQWITNDFCPVQQLPSKLNATELVMITALGYVLEGWLNPWWQRSIDSRLAASSFSPAISGTLRVLLDICIFTPLCCELYLVSEHVVVEGHWRDYYISAAVALYQLFDVRLVDAATIDAALARPLDITSELLDEVSSSRVWDAVRAVLARAVPPPLRPVVRQLAEATGWTVLEHVSL